MAALLAVVALALLGLAASTALAAPPSEFGEEGSGAGQFAPAPSGIAVDQESGDVYLLDTDNARVDKFGSEGEFLLAFGWGVADGSAELQTCGPESVPLSSTCRAGLFGSGSGQFGGEVNGIVVDNSGTASQGDVYVSERFSNYRIQKFGPEGSFELMIGGEVNKAGGNLCLASEECQAGSQGTGPGEFAEIAPGIAVASTGALFAGNSGTVQRFSSAGAFESQVAIPGTNFIPELLVDSSGDFYISSFELSGIHKYDAGGTELGEPRDPTAEEPVLITMGPGDQLFVDHFITSEQRFQIDTYDPAGPQLSSFASPEDVQSIAYGATIERLYVARLFSIALVPVPAPGTPFILAGSESASQVQPTTATLNATINPEGGEETTYRFQYVDAESFANEGGFASPNTEKTTPTELTGEPFADQPASTPIEGLQPRTTYHFRVLATNKAGKEAEGPDQTFETLPPVSIDSTSVSNVSATAATLETELNPHGLPSTYRFEYDTAPYVEGEAPHGTSTPTASAGSGLTDVLRTAKLQGLAPTTTYHYRVVAENPLGEGLEASFGPDHTFTTQGAFASLLPDGRGWELVSPPDKHGVPLEAISDEGAVIQAAADGHALAYAAYGSISAAALGNRSATKSELLASRGAGGWVTRDVTTPHREPAGLNPGEQTEYRLFSDDLSQGAVEPNGATPLSPLTSERTPYLLGPDASYLPLVIGCPPEGQPCPPAIAEHANVPAGTEFAGKELAPENFAGGGPEFITATPDFAHLLLSSAFSLVEGFDTGGQFSIYEWSEASSPAEPDTLQPVGLIPPGGDTICGGTAPAACVSGGGSSAGKTNYQVRNAISADGSRVVFRSGNLYLRDLPRGETVQLDVGQGKSGHGDFQLASTDGSRVFFTDTERLTADSTAKQQKPDLYMCQIGESAGHLTCDLTDLTVNTFNPSEPAFVQGTVIGAAEDGSSVYFVANGALVSGAVPGNCSGKSGAGACDLYRYDTETNTTRFIAVLSGADFHDWNGAEADLGQLTARVSPNGRYLAFMSERPLTGYDNRDAKSAARDQEVFLFDSAAAPGEALACASCNPTGARPDGIFNPQVFPGLLVDRPQNTGQKWLAASIPGWTRVDLVHALYQSRYLSNSGRLFFNAADSLVPTDTNGTFDVYEFEFPQAPGQPASNTCTTSSTTYSPTSGGCASLISSGTSPEESAFLDASETGDDVFFLTASKLAPTDEDAALDVYDARVGGSANPPVKPVECVGDGCQQPAVPPGFESPGTSLVNGPENVLQCPKGKVKQKGKCVAKKHKKAKHHKQSKKRHAKVNRGAGK